MTEEDLLRTDSPPLPSCLFSNSETLSGDPTGQTVQFSLSLLLSTLFLFLNRIQDIQGQPSSSRLLLLVKIPFLLPIFRQIFKKSKWLGFVVETPIVFGLIGGILIRLY